MMDLGYSLATLNASLNGTAAILLILGWRAIRTKKEDRHKKLMGSAFIISCLFLVSYIIRILIEGTHAFPGEGIWRSLYLSLLASHIILAAFVPFLAVRTIYLALKRRLEAHRQIAAVTLPIWIYVSVTGVLIYLWLYHWV